MSNGHLRCNTSTGGALILHSHPTPPSVFLVLEHGSATDALTGAAMLRVFLEEGKKRGGKREEEQSRGVREEGRRRGEWEKEKTEGGRVGEEERKERRKEGGWKKEAWRRREGLDEGRRRREERRTEGWRRKEVRERPREDSATTEK